MSFNARSGRYPISTGSHERNREGSDEGFNARSGRYPISTEINYEAIPSKAVSMPDQGGIPFLLLPNSQDELRGFVSMPDQGGIPFLRT